MCNENPKVSELPDVLQDLVYMFAWNLPKDQVSDSLGVYLEIESWKLPFWFFNKRMWSWHYSRYFDNPLKSFMPIEYFGGKYREVFNVDAVYCFLIGLDFRMKNVRLFGSRALWEMRILETWRVMDSVADFYKMLMRSQTRVLRKNTAYEAFYHMKSP
jgi:hypothetical protein